MRLSVTSTAKIRPIEIAANILPQDTTPSQPIIAKQLRPKAQGRCSV